MRVELCEVLLRTAFRLHGTVLCGECLLCCLVGFGLGCVVELSLM